MTNIEMTGQALEGLTPEEKDVFHYYVVGAVGVWIDQARWQLILSDARAYVERRRAELKGAA